MELLRVPTYVKQVYPQFVVVSSRELRNLHMKIRAISRTMSVLNEDLRDLPWDFIEHGLAKSTL